MDEKLLKKLQTQSVEMARRMNITEAEALEILKKGRAKRNPGKAKDEGSFEGLVRAAIAGGLEPQKAFRQILREHPDDAKDYLKRIQAGGPDGLKEVVK